MNERKIEQDMFNDIYKKLINLGYPEKTIVFDLPIFNGSRNVRLDLVIVDENTGTPLAGIETIYTSTHGHLGTERMLHGYQNFSGNNKLPIYLIDKDMSIKYIKPDGEIIDLQSLPPYYALRSLSLSELRSIKEKALKNTEEKQEKTIDLLNIFSWILGGACFILFGLTVAGKIKITTEQLGLLGLAIALIIFPFMKKLKILGVEMERNEKDIVEKKD